MESKSFIKKMFHGFYQKGYNSNRSFVQELEKHEFGFILFEGWMVRHKSFKNVEQLGTFLRDCVPSDSYFSCAYYENPEAEMDEKVWLGADLIFDIDADHIPTPCNKIHDKWECNNCGFSGRGITPEKCPICRGEKFEVSTWPCETCLASAKAETIRLIDILVKDFGLSENEIRVFFSGHRGYHVHIESEVVRSFDAIARKEIVDYMTCQGLDIMLDSKKRKRGPFYVYLGDFGWVGRIKDGMANFVIKAMEEDLMKIGLKKNVAKAVFQSREAVLKNLNLGTLEGIRGVGFESIRKLIEHVVKEHSVKIDTVVTTDIHRLIRLPETLHGKTGLRKVEFEPSEIDNFDPFKNAIAFKEGFVTVFVSDAPEFRIGDEIYGPFRNQKATLPTAAAVLLVCKQKAEVIE